MAWEYLMLVVLEIVYLELCSISCTVNLAITATDTQLQEPDMTENVNKIITFASGEGNRPLGV